MWLKFSLFLGMIFSMRFSILDDFIFSHRALRSRYADFVRFAHFAQNLLFVSQDLHFRFYYRWNSNSSSWTFCNNLDLFKNFESTFFDSILVSLVHNLGILRCFSTHLLNEWLFWKVRYFQTLYWWLIYYSLFICMFRIFGRDIW